jgi:hypothetical protein
MSLLKSGLEEGRVACRYQIRIERRSSHSGMVYIDEISMMTRDKKVNEEAIMTEECERWN